jgi:Ca2+-binding EF-hand superfamily protein
MRKILLAAAGLAALAGAAGLALAQDNDGRERGAHGIFQSDSNSDGVLTRQEFDVGRVASFARLDADNNGQLTREEMRAERGERRGGRGGHRGGGMHSLTRADANSDGNITRDEFLARPTQMFDRLDANDDGVISTAERPQRPERGERTRGERTQRSDRPNPDADGNGSFSQAEFTAMGAGLFERLDANDDGRVTQEEAQAARGHHRRDRS